MAKRSKGTSRFRDTKTGRFVPKSAYNRSKAHGGNRYKRVNIPPPSGTKRDHRGEYQINVKYKPTEKSTKVEVQISAQGPKGASREQVLSAVEYRRKNGEDKKGWKVNIVEWKKRSKKLKSTEGWSTLGFFVGQASKAVEGAK
jgi:hypothetical protein